MIHVNVSVCAPQTARWNVTSKEALQRIGEYSEAAITIRGTYFPPGKEPKEGERKIYLAIESTLLAPTPLRSSLTRSSLTRSPLHSTYLTFTQSRMSINSCFIIRTSFQSREDY